MKPYNKNLKQPSRDLRSNMTNAEQLLWQRIRRKQILGLQFYRHKPMLNFIVDFYCFKANLIIECDGGQHYTEQGMEAGQNRDQTLAQLGLNVLRFDNGQVINQLDYVIEKIYQFVEKRISNLFLKKIRDTVKPLILSGINICCY
ncbi:endonuclease domain-containing protein [Acinetobacter modestus]|uniref:DUF559 domain-containing protein n=1 Tax=Acinetobacter modestus TaxID=1776740 RepID=A0ABP2TZJ2_9GAMM|nr:endonuclease domain-containing protein [Acinetobacter modestus]ENU27650.1 hypothetical protein F992_01275 [Acinetobacter modestus]GGA15239.1 hypothetical protein GCM10017554_09670 [Acinetobacter modestus]